MVFLLYSEYLAQEFDVISIAISGQKKSELKISTFLQLKSNRVIDKPDDENTFLFMIMK